jgi:hypothetical protein
MFSLADRLEHFGFIGVSGIAGYGIETQRQGVDIWIGSFFDGSELGEKFDYMRLLARGAAVEIRRSGWVSGYRTVRKGHAIVGAQEFCEQMNPDDIESTCLRVGVELCLPVEGNSVVQAGAIGAVLVAADRAPIGGVPFRMQARQPSVVEASFQQRRSLGLRVPTTSEATVNGIDLIQYVAAAKADALILPFGRTLPQ